MTLIHLLFRPSLCRLLREIAAYPRGLHHQSIISLDEADELDELLKAGMVSVVGRLCDRTDRSTIISQAGLRALSTIDTIKSVAPLALAFLAMCLFMVLGLSIVEG